MINLLPYDYKQDLTYARKNYLLIKWLAAIFIAVIFIVTISFGGVYVINSERAKAESTAKSEYEQITQSSDKAEFDKYKKFKTNYDIVAKLLSKQLRYTKIIQDIGRILPEGTNIEGIKLSPGTAALSLSVSGNSQAAIKKAFVNISDNTLFPKADIESITCGDNSAGKACTATIKVLLNTDSNYYYINSLSKATN